MHFRHESDAIPPAVEVFGSHYRFSAIKGHGIGDPRRISRHEDPINSTATLDLFQDSNDKGQPPDLNQGFFGQARAGKARWDNSQCLHEDIPPSGHPHRRE
jgi:hypothetical protein